MRYLKWTGITLGGLVTILILLIVILSGIGGMRVTKTYDIQVAAVDVPADPASIERGRHFIEAVALCQECHGEKFEGQVLEDDPLFGRFAPANLTSGIGGVGGSLTDEDYVRAIRHGVNRDGKAIFVMPSELYTEIGDDDLGAMIAYLKTLPPVDSEVPKSKAGILARVITVFDPSLFPAASINHTAEPPRPPTPGVTIEYGEYLTVMCSLCRGENFGGGTVPDESQARAPNLTKGGALVAWSEGDFIQTLRTGTTPFGNNLKKENMPWERFGKMTDDELKAVWLYLQSLPPVTPEQ